MESLDDIFDALLGYEPDWTHPSPPQVIRLAWWGQRAALSAPRSAAPQAGG